ncbi:hypothetical protein NXS19_008689 [Fusarium pseudograminearum]|nr:hypothetical protein NXS19_008689 [Fusarium pseudograminearum]
MSKSYQQNSHRSFASCRSNPFPCRCTEEGIALDGTLADQSIPSDRLDPGSSIFLLVKVRVHVAKDMQKERRECPQQEIDNLIEALEQELGDSTISYMTVKLSYRLSAFPERQDVGSASDEMFSTHSKIETVVTASVKLHNAMSLWSPPPTLKPNPLLPLIQRH